jgi:small subunit ribosomal protein S16
MSVKIRLKRVGKKKAPSYRVVVADSRSPRDGRIIENIGWYNPLVEPSAIHIDEEKAFKWLNVGAQPTDSVASLLKRTGAMERFEQTKSNLAAATQTEE